jgi:predicted alpha/beta-fold hydrolase
MNRGNGVYRPPAWLPGGHAQTIYPVLLRRPQVRYRRQRVNTPDGDFVDFDWLDVPAATAATPLVVRRHTMRWR